MRPSISDPAQGLTTLSSSTPSYLTAVAPAPQTPPVQMCSVCGYWGKHACNRCVRLPSPCVPTDRSGTALLQRDVRGRARREPLRTALIDRSSLYTRALCTLVTEHSGLPHEAAQRQRVAAVSDARRIDLLDLRQREHDASAIRGSEVTLERVALEVDRLELRETGQLRLDVGKLGQLVVARLHRERCRQITDAPRTR